MKRKHSHALAIAFGAALLSTLGSTPAQSCGGFFCASTPIDQSGEYILFSIEETGVRAYIQVQYQGKAADFAWVVPVMKAPTKIGVGVQQVFTSIMATTVPSFQTTWELKDEAKCNRRFGGAAGSANSPPGASADAGASVKVTVVDKGEVGPYEYVVLEAKDAEQLTTWLTTNGFNQPPEATAALAHYVQQNFAFVAIKLKRDAEVGEIQPLVLDMPHQEACVPLVLTRIAALPNMPVYAMVLGKHRAVPRNWFEVEPNWRKIDWGAGGSNYRSLVTKAIDEAQGRAFVTESAGPTSRFAGTLWGPGRYDLSELRLETDPAQFVNTMLNLGLPRDPLVQSLLRKYLPMPDAVRARGVSEPTFYNNLTAYKADLAGQPFDPVAFANAIDERIVTPLKDAQMILDRQPYFTRLFTTISADEMTRDPLFDFNPDLGPVENRHTVVVTGACTDSGDMQNVQVRYPDGTNNQISGTVPAYSWSAINSKLSVSAEHDASRILLNGPSGAAIPIARTKAALFDSSLDSVDPKLVRDLARREPPPPPETAGNGAAPANVSGGCGCRVGEPSGAVEALPLAAMVWLAARRRRRPTS